MAKKFDLHVHSNYSKDSINSIDKLIQKYSKLKFDGFAITDHGDMNALPKARAYAKEKNIEIEIIGGCEFLSDKGEVLGLCIEEMINEKEFGPLCDAIHDQGGFAVLPHPFDSLRGHACNPTLLPPELLKLIDGIETLNAHCLYPSFNQKASQYALQHSLLSTAGSDAHFLFECGAAFTEIPENMQIEISLRRKKTIPKGKILPFYVHGPPKLTAWAKKLGIIQKPSP
ncbi:MAG: PHP domain-containing protein [Candidatus Micrarchaeota archaeon]